MELPTGVDFYDALAEVAPMTVIDHGMKSEWDVDGLLAFERDIEETFNKGLVKAPVHLAGGNEKQLIDIFAKKVRADDWCLCSWRSHYHCLLKGVPGDEVKQAIIDGRSIALCFPEYKILSSAIVGGIAPIAVGLAMAIKAEDRDELVHVFLGDMSINAGIVREAMHYSAGHDLPIHWILEDNGLSVATDTKAVWGIDYYPEHFSRYTYEMTVQHVGTGQWVSL